MPQKTICAQLSWQLFDKQSQRAFHPTLLEGLMTAASVQIMIFTATLMLAYHMSWRWVNSRSSLLSLSSSFLGETWKELHGVGGMRRRPRELFIISGFGKSHSLGYAVISSSSTLHNLYNCSEIPIPYMQFDCSIRIKKESIWRSNILKRIDVNNSAISIDLEPTSIVHGAPPWAAP